MTDFEETKAFLDKLGIKYREYAITPYYGKALELGGMRVETDNGNLGCDFRFYADGSFEQVKLYEN